MEKSLFERLLAAGFTLDFQQSQIVICLQDRQIALGYRVAAELGECLMRAGELVGAVYAPRERAQAEAAAAAEAREKAAAAAAFLEAQLAEQRRRAAEAAAEEAASEAAAPTDSAPEPKPTAEATLTDAPD